MAERLKSRSFAPPADKRDRRLLDLYSTPRWRAFRAEIKRTRVLCERCKAIGCFKTGDHVHHRKDPRVAPMLAFDEANVELLCVACHNREHHGRPAVSAPARMQGVGGSEPR